MVSGNTKIKTPIPKSNQEMGGDCFEIDSDGFVTKCPKGLNPIDHRILSANNTTDRAIHVIFDGDACRACAILDQCPVRDPNHRVRGCDPRNTVGDFRLEITPRLLLRDQMYLNQQTDEWKDRYKIRSGIEATMSELIRTHGFRKLRVRRAPKVCFAVDCKLIACNIKRWTRVCEGLFYCFILYVMEQLGQLQINLVKL